MPILSVKNLTTRFWLQGRQVPVVDGLNFDLWAGKTLALVGESGCGKSMTALSLMGLLPQPPALPPEGEALYRGVNLLSLGDKQMRHIRGKKIAMVFQDPASALNPVYTIGAQLVEVAEEHLNMYGDEAAALAIKSLTDVGIASAADRMDDYPHQLSGGMRQRVMIAMALLCNPDILIADEPTTALDVTIQAQILSLIRQLQRDRGMAVLLITHDMGVVAELADDVIVMYATEPVEWGSVLDIFDHMSHPYTQALFAARPALHKVGERLTSIKGMVPPLTQLPSGCRFNPRCPYAMPVCREGKVDTFAAPRSGEREHGVRCWLRQRERP